MYKNMGVTYSLSGVDELECKVYEPGDYPGEPIVMIGGDIKLFLGSRKLARNILEKLMSDLNKLDRIEVKKEG